MNIQEFLATVAEDYSLSFSDLRNRLYCELDYLDFNGADLCKSDFKDFLKRFRIETVTNDSVFLFLEQCNSLSIDQCAARMNKALYSFLCGGIISLCIVSFVLKKTLHN